jgi:hypothetical protein
MKVGDLVELKPSRLDPTHEPHIGKIGIVVEQTAPDEEFAPSDPESWWVQWQGNSDWDIECEDWLVVLSE